MIQRKALRLRISPTLRFLPDPPINCPRLTLNEVAAGALYRRAAPREEKVCRWMFLQNFR